MALPALLARAAMAKAVSVGGGRYLQAAAGAYGYSLGYGVSALAGAASSVATRELGYQAEAWATNHIADPSQVMQCYWADKIDSQQLKTGLSYHGIPFNGMQARQANANTEMWRQVLLHSQPHFDVSTAVDFYHKGLLDREQAVGVLAQSGFSQQWQVALLLRNRGWYDLGTATDLWRGGLIDNGQYVDRMNEAGIGEPDAQDALFALRTPLPIGTVVNSYWIGTLTAEQTARQLQLHGYSPGAEQQQVTDLPAPYGADAALVLFWRGLIGNDQFGRELGAAGITTPDRQATWYRGARPIPGAGEIITFAVRDAWDNGVVESFGYDAEYPTELDFWQKAEGWGWGSDANTLPGAPPGGVDWPRLRWRAHWAVMSPTQGYRAFHRLRPDRIARYAERVPGVEPFIWEDLQRVLKIADYPPKLRKWLAASAFAVLPIYVVRSLYRLGKRPRAWLVDQLRDRGFTEDDATSVADNEDAVNQGRAQKFAQSIADGGLRAGMQSVLASYRLGALSAGEAVAQLVSVGVETTTANGLINLGAAAENLALVKDSLKRLRSGWLAGEFTVPELQAQLANVGIQPDAIQRYVARWTLARSQARRMASTSQIVGWVGEGRLSMEVGRQRLLNLGWTNPDALLLLADAQSQIDDAHAKAVKAETQARTKAQRDMEAVVRRCKSLGDSVQASLRRMTPLAQLKQLYTDEIVSHKWISERLALMGYTDDVATAYLAEWQMAMEAKASKKNGAVPAASKAAPPASAAVPDAQTPVPGVIPTDSQGPKVVGGTVQIGQANPPPSQP